MEDLKYVKAVYSVETEIALPANAVFGGIIQLNRWWPEKFEGDEPGPGTEFVLSSGAAHYSKNKVIAFVPAHKFAWLTTESLRKPDLFSWSGTQFIFELKPSGENTVVKFTYDGVVLEPEYGRLVEICDLTVREMLFNFLVHGKEVRRK